MQEKYLQPLIEIMPYLNEIMQDDITTIIFDLRTLRFSAYEPGKRLRAPIKVGDKFEEDSVMLEMKKSKKQFPSIVPKEFFGVPAKGLLTPIIDEKGEVVAVFSVSRSIEVEMKIEEGTSSIFSTMEQLNAGIEEASANSQLLSSFIKGIVDFSAQTQSKVKEIDNIIQVIKSISSQSNLLALNATIEAARAGEAGRGFSVVANEMGKLSSLSKDSAEKVAKSLFEMKNAIETIAEQINKASLTSESQAAVTQELAASVDEIVGVSKQLSEVSKINSVEEMLSNKADNVVIKNKFF